VYRYIRVTEAAGKVVVEEVNDCVGSNDFYVNLSAPDR
jgi:hypothetical protein